MEIYKLNILQKIILIFTSILLLFVSFSDAAHLATVIGIFLASLIITFVAGQIHFKFPLKLESLIYKFKLRTRIHYWWLNGQIDKVEEAYKHLGMGHEFCFNCKRYTIHNNINGIIICKSCRVSKKAAFDKHIERLLGKVSSDDHNDITPV